MPDPGELKHKLTVVVGAAPNGYPGIRYRNFFFLNNTETLIEVTERELRQFVGENGRPTDAAKMAGLGVVVAGEQRAAGLEDQLLKLARERDEARNESAQLREELRRVTAALQQETGRREHAEKQAPLKLERSDVSTTLLRPGEEQHSPRAQRPPQAKV